MKTYGPWEVAIFCRFCDHEISFYQKVNSHGWCPYCGEKSDTIDPNRIPTVECAKRLVCDAPWWKFWDAGQWEYKREA